MKFTSIAFLSSLILLTACSSKDQSAAADKLMEKDDNTIVVDMQKAIKDEGSMEHDGMMMEEGKMDMEKTAYMAYSEGVIGNGDSAVLFFAASWCSACQANDKRLQSWYDSEQFPISVYKLDYDKENDLKSRYGIVQQDMFVRIDGNGNAQQIISSPDETSLRNIING